MDTEGFEKTMVRLLPILRLLVIAGVFCIILVNKHLSPRALLTIGIIMSSFEMVNLLQRRNGKLVLNRIIPLASLLLSILGIAWMLWIHGKTYMPLVAIAYFTFFPGLATYSIYSLVVFCANMAKVLDLKKTK